MRTKFLSTDMREREHLGDLRVGAVILPYILGNSFELDPSDTGLSSRTLGPHNRQGIS